MRAWHHDRIATRRFSHKSVHDFVLLQENGNLNLSPGFQRKSVWGVGLRRKLIESVLEGYPVPSIFLYRREEGGRPVFDVIDGKQRLETLFRFMRTKGSGTPSFDLKHRFTADSTNREWNWTTLSKAGHQGKVTGYRLAVTEVSGPVSEIIDLFVRINSTGKALTGAERRKARYFNSPLLQVAEKLARKFRKYLQQTHVLSATQIERMKDVGLMSELLASVLAEQPIDQKSAIDKAIGNQAVNGNSLKRAHRAVVSAINTQRRVVPNLGETRFRNTSEFYTLLLVIWDLSKRGLVLSDAKRNKAAQALLTKLSSEVDRARELQRKLKGVEKSNELAREYLGTVLSGTDKLTNRLNRATILRGLLDGVFEKKDDERLFSAEVRRLLWNSTESKLCPVCKKKLGWHTVQVDHKKLTPKEAAPICRTRRSSTRVATPARGREALSAHAHAVAPEEASFRRSHSSTERSW
ncbi:MAG: DUF262 domain-containing protein [Deltaproteobacteria bacterium]|nr:DUF262 domain-containing protein [Deltaproteobacteria bacterium]